MKLTKDNMKKKLGMTDEEVALVLKYQKAFPSLQDTNKEATVDGRTLWTELRVKDKFTDWLPRQLETIDAIEEKDFFCLNRKTSELGGRPTNDYTLTLETAKEICMVIGAAPRTNKETKELSKLARKYFILVERAFRQAEKWEDTYKVSDTLRREMMSAYENAYVDKYSRKPRNYGEIQDEVYIICFDMTAKELKEQLDIKYNEGVPQWIEEKIEKVLCYTYQKMITLFELGKLNKEERWDLAVKMFDKKYGGIIKF